jgi:hypothetical protein
VYPNIDPPEITEEDIENDFWDEVERAESRMDNDRENFEIC